MLSDYPDDDLAATTWRAVYLAPLFAGEQTENPPTMGVRVDGPALLYPGKVHATNGPPESCKGWFNLLVATIALETGAVVYIDFEDSAVTMVERLVALDADEQLVLERFHYVRPDEPLDTQGVQADLERHVNLEPVLVVIDGVTEAMTLQGFDLKDNSDFATFLGTVVRPFARRGAAVSLIDHVVKDPAARGRYAIGAQHKLAGVDVAYSFETIRPFSRGGEGLVQIAVQKDRPGYVRAHATGDRIALMKLRSDDGLVTIELGPPDPTPALATPELADVTPSARRVYAILEVADYSLGVQEIGDRLAQDGKGYPLKRRTIYDAIAILTERGLVVNLAESGVAAQYCALANDKVHVKVDLVTPEIANEVRNAF